MVREIVELKKQVAFLEDLLIENQKQQHEKVDWYSNQLMKCDKQKEALEGEVSVLKSEKEALKNDAIKQDKELSTAVATLNLRDEQYAAMDQVLVGLKDELNQLHTTISALKADLIARQDECEVLKKQIVKDSEKLEECSHQISDLSTTLSKEKEEKALLVHFRHGTHQSPTASLMPSSVIVLREALQLNEAESTGLKEEIAGLKLDLQTYKGHCKRQSEAIVKLKEELNSIKVGGGSMCFILLYMKMHSTVMQIHE